jgi:hypothetical protein
MATPSNGQGGSPGKHRHAPIPASKASALATLKGVGEDPFPAGMRGYRVAFQATMPTRRVLPPSVEKPPCGRSFLIACPGRRGITATCPRLCGGAHCAPDICC